MRMWLVCAKELMKREELHSKRTRSLPENWVVNKHFPSSRSLPTTRCGVFFAIKKHKKKKGFQLSPIFLFATQTPYQNLLNGWTFVMCFLHSSHLHSLPKIFLIVFLSIFDLRPACKPYSDPEIESKVPSSEQTEPRAQVLIVRSKREFRLLFLVIVFRCF